MQQRLAWEQSDRTRKAQWWQLAQQAVALLRSSYGVDRIGVIDNLVQSDLLNYWSDLTLVVWGDKLKHEYQIYQTLSKLDELPPINVLQAEWDYKTVEEWAIEHTIVEI